MLLEHGHETQPTSQPAARSSISSRSSTTRRANWAARCSPTQSAAGTALASPRRCDGCDGGESRRRRCLSMISIHTVHSDPWTSSQSRACRAESHGAHTAASSRWCARSTSCRCCPGGGCPRHSASWSQLMRRRCHTRRAAAGGKWAAGEAGAAGTGLGGRRDGGRGAGGDRGLLAQRA